MNPVIVKPSQDLDLLQITQSLGLELIDCLKHLKLVSIAINTSDSAWCVSLNAADSGLWRRAASKMSRDIRYLGL